MLANLSSDLRLILCSNITKFFRENVPFMLQLNTVDNSENLTDNTSSDYLRVIFYI
jgi:hypothetical protein